MEGYIRVIHFAYGSHAFYIHEGLPSRRQLVKMHCQSRRTFADSCSVMHTHFFADIHAAADALKNEENVHWVGRRRNAAKRAVREKWERAVSGDGVVRRLRAAMKRSSYRFKQQLKGNGGMHGPVVYRGAGEEAKSVGS